MMLSSFLFTRRVCLSCMPVVAAFRQALTVWKRVCQEQGQQRQHEQVAQVADLLSREIGIWQVEASTQLKAVIAQGAQQELYRGFLLCSDAQERTFLLDTHSGNYVTATHASVLQIDGLAQARRFVDALCRVQAA